MTSRWKRCFSTTSPKTGCNPSLDFRGELDFRGDEKRLQERENRDFRRISGNVHLFERDAEDSQRKEVTNVPGPYVKTWREHLLRRLLETQVIVREKAPDEMKKIELISLAELSEIRRIWLEEKHEFDDILPCIYEAATGEPFQDFRSSSGQSFLGLDEWSILEEICDDPMHFELMTRLLSTERKFQTMSRRVGIIDALEKHFDTSSRDQDAAIDNAHLNWNIKKAAKAGDVEAVQQLTVSVAPNPENQPVASWAEPQI